MSSTAAEFDVIVVGARCAGSPLAADLAGRGLRVCVVDKARFPSETLSTHLIQPCGVKVVERLGVVDELLAADAVPITKLTQVDDETRIEADYGPETFGSPAICMRRVTLDEILVKAAQRAGAEVRTETAVTGVLEEGGRVCGVETEAGQIRAPLVVGADGRQSRVAEAVGAREYHVAPPGRSFAWAYFEGGGDGDPRIRLGRKGEITYLGCPTDGGFYMAAVCPKFKDREGLLRDREAAYMEGLRAWPELEALVAGGRRVGPIRLMARWHGYFREGAGLGWALLGDAGNFKDPTPAQGISDALRHGAALADAIERGLGGGGAGLDGELGDWWLWRDRDAYEIHWFAADTGAGSSPLLASWALRDVAGDEEATEGMFRILNHDVAPSDFFGPARMGRAIARGIREEPRQAGAAFAEMGTALWKQAQRAWRFRREERRIKALRARR